MIIISIFQLIFNIFSYPENLWAVASLKRKKITAIFLFLSILTSIPYATASIESMKAISRDMQVISERIPAFKIENGELNLDKQLDQALLVKTDSSNFVINSDKTTNPSLIQREIERVPLSFLMDKTRFRIATPENHLDVNYSILEGMNDQTFKAIMVDFGNLSLYTLIPVILISFLIGAIDGAFQIVLIALMANIFSSLFRIRLPFTQNLKIVLVASFVPVGFMSLLNAYGIFPLGQTAVITLITLYIYHKGIIEHIGRL